MTDLEWPDNAEGGVFRSLQADNFDFSTPAVVDFNVDFVDWPPPEAAVDLLRARYGECEVIPPEMGEDGSEWGGYLQIQIEMLVVYNDVVITQYALSQLMKPYGGICESWGLFGP